MLLPQEFGCGIDKDHDQAGRELFSCCVSHLESADMIIAILDGPMVDDGTAWEIGYFFHFREGRSKPIIGLRTDFRNAGELKGSIVNLMIEQSCDQIVRSEEELIEVLRRIVQNPSCQ